MVCRYFHSLRLAAPAPLADAQYGTLVDRTVLRAHSFRYLVPDPQT